MKNGKAGNVHGNRAAEEAVLAVMFSADPQQAGEILDRITDDSFFSSVICRELFTVFRNLILENRSIDQSIVSARLRDNGTYNIAGGDKFLKRLTGKGVSENGSLEESLPEYIDMLEKGRLRRLYSERIKAETQRIENGFDPFVALQSLNDFAFKMLTDRSDKGFITLRQAAFEYLKETEEALRNGKPRGISTKIPDLDAYIGGFRSGNQIVIAGRPGAGKSAFAEQLAINVASEPEDEVAICSLEMSAHQYAARAFANQSKVNLFKLESLRGLKKEDVIKIAAMLENRQASFNRIHIDDTAGASLRSIRFRLQRLKAQRPNLKVAFIDYIQIMNLEQTRGMTRNEALGIVSQGLLQLGRDLRNNSSFGKSIVQANANGGKPQEPTLQDLRDSGAIEQDAFTVLAVHPEYQSDHIVNIMILKQRQGPVGSFQLRFEKEFVRFMQLTKQGRNEHVNEHMPSSENLPF